jgi:hypothetical protein
MKLRRSIRIVALILGVIAVLYFAIGGIYIHLESQREESWHEKAVANASDQTVAEWRLAKGSQPVAEWFFVNEKRHTYVVRLFDDREYVSAIYNRVVHGVGDPYDSPMPVRFETGKVSISEWRAFESLLESIYENRQQFYANSHRKNGNVTLAYSRNNASPNQYRLYSNEYQQWPSTYRDFDDRLFAAMESWSVKPHHGYSRVAPDISYESEDLPGLVRLLRSDREAAYPPIVSRMVALGEPARTALIEVLRSGEEVRYLPISRYSAVMDGLAELGDAGDAGFATMKKIAETPVSLPGRKALKAHATAIVGAHEVKLHIERNWKLSPAVETPFRTSTLLPAEREIVDAALADINVRFDAKRKAAKATLVDMGAPILPAVLNRLKVDQARNPLYRELLDVLAEVGGWQAFIYAIREDGMKPSRATRPLQRIGSGGVRGLLLLMESSDKVARMESFFALAKDEYAAYSTQYIAQLDRNLNLYRTSSSAAVRDVHTEASVNLMKLLQKHDPVNHNNIDVLLKAAMDVEQAEQTRVMAVNSLAGLAPLPDAAEKQLRELAGFESGEVYKALEARRR